MNSFDEELVCWEKEATADAFWAILSDPTKRNGKWNQEEFFGTGLRRIEALCSDLEMYHHNSWEHVLDFGCGVGRLTRALADKFHHATGIDVSETMISKARELNADIPNASFKLNKREDLTMFPASEFDLVFTEHVLQHVNNIEQIKKYISEFIRILKPNGILVFQLPSHINLIYRFRLRRKLFYLLKFLGFGDNYLRTKMHLNPILMNSIQCNDMLAFFETFPVSLLHHREISNGPIRNATYILRRNPV